jgi:phage terminase large subunit-like protein
VTDTLEELIRLKAEKARLLEEAVRERDELPHLYLYKHYTWGRKFYDSMNKRNILCAANQLSKSSTMIRRFIHRATSPEMWKIWYPKLQAGQIPTPFWYGYPSFPVATQEFLYKWKQFLPKGAMKDDSKYGWQEKMKNGYIEKIAFNSGVDIVFKAYKQDPQDLQSGSVWEMGLDEEPPADLMSELLMRMNATKGYFNAAFTATQGQKFWKEIVEEKRRWNGEDGEEPAFVQQVSLYDSQYYEDGTASPWDERAIRHAISLCSTEAEVARRVYGKFIVDEGLKYSSFARSRNTTKERPNMGEYPLVYAAIDYGSGGKAHPSAICFVGVDNEYTKARVIKCWRSARGVDVTNEDVVKKYLEMARGMNVLAAYYDWAAKDLSTIAMRLGLSFTKADKAHDLGEATLNTLFKTGALKIYLGEDTDGELMAEEFESLLAGTSKNNAADDLVDTARYCCASIPWNWEVITGLKEDEKPRSQTAYERARPNATRVDPLASQDEVDRELEYWDEMMV